MRMRRAVDKDDGKRIRMRIGRSQEENGGEG